MIENFMDYALRQDDSILLIRGGVIYRGQVMNGGRLFHVGDLPLQEIQISLSLQDLRPLPVAINLSRGPFAPTDPTKLKRFMEAAICKRPIEAEPKEDVMELADESERIDIEDFGLNMIIRERLQQIEKHGFSDDMDDLHIKEELREAAVSIIDQDCKRWPWDDELLLFQYIMSKPRVDQLATAGAFLAAEIGRINRLVKDARVILEHKKSTQTRMAELAGYEDE